MPAAITQCVTWQQAPGRAAVRCWTPTGKEIQLCGHGMLCCAHYWRGQWGGHGVLEMNGTEVQCDNRAGLAWLAFPRLETLSCEIPAWAAPLLGKAPALAAKAGPENGYLVLEMPSGCELVSLTAPGTALETYTLRSLIVTRQVDAAESVCGENIQYRYFAPQHGVPEDTATGSAMRVISAYWQARGVGDKLRALQRSADGGWLASRMEKDRTWIGGRVIEDDGREAA